MYLTINDIFKRINHGRRTNVREASIDVNSINLYTKHDKFIFENARYMITNWESFDSNTNIAFDKASTSFVFILITWKANLWAVFFPTPGSLENSSINLLIGPV